MHTSYINSRAQRTFLENQVKFKLQQVEAPGC